MHHPDLVAAAGPVGDDRMGGDPVRAVRGSDADIARENGWTVGARLVGDEGYGPSIIEITAIGRAHVLAVWNGERESLTCLTAREWRIAP